MTLFDEIAREPSNHVAFSLEAGDMVVINNYVVMHARKAFEDYPEPSANAVCCESGSTPTTSARCRRSSTRWVRRTAFLTRHGRSCSYDFQKLFREVDPRLLGTRRHDPPSART